MLFSTDSASVAGAYFCPVIVVCVLSDVGAVWLTEAAPLAILLLDNFAHTLHFG
jgi:hypothetical protein